MDIDQLLTATRSARRSLDLDAAVDLDDIRECLRIGLHAPNGSNQQSWRWLVITERPLREKIAGLYRDAYLRKVGGQLIAGFMPSGTPEAKLMSSTEWLVEKPGLDRHVVVEKDLEIGGRQISSRAGRAEPGAEHTLEEDPIRRAIQDHRLPIEEE